jgi:hypothetical protein
MAKMALRVTNTVSVEVLHWGKVVLGGITTIALVPQPQVMVVEEQAVRVQNLPDMVELELQE